MLGCFQGDGMGGWGVRGAAQNSLASQGCGQRGFHKSSIDSVEVLNCSLSLCFSCLSEELVNFPMLFSDLSLASNHWFACVCLCVCMFPMSVKPMTSSPFTSPH